jgi:DNA polymerase-3 subunit delta'
MSFSGILGHDRQIAVLKRNIVTGQIPSAYLFHGDEGVGKRLVAQEFAKALNCTGEREPGDSCGICQPCRNIDAGCHPNIATLTLAVNPDTGKMRQEIVIGQVRAAQDFLSLTAVGDGRKVLIIDDAHQMNTEAMNALLKTLEEPPHRTHVVLVTSRPGSLLATILSRCRAISYQPLNEGLVSSLLMREKGMDEAGASLVARMTGGRVGAALSADPADLAQRRKKFLDLVGSLPERDYGEILKDAEEAAKEEGMLDDFVSFGTLWFRDLLVILVGGEPGLAYNRDMAGELLRWSETTTPYRCEESLALLKQTGRALERTYNRRILAEDLFFRLKEGGAGAVRA